MFENFKTFVDDKHLQVLSKFLALHGEVLQGRIPIKGGDSKGCPPDQFVSNFYRMHDLIRGIYTPKHSSYALSVMVKDKGPFGTEITYFSPMDWRIEYRPPVDTRGKHDIETLQNCFNNNVPVGILRNIKKSFNEVLGLGKIINVHENTFSIIPYVPSDSETKAIEPKIQKYVEAKISSGDFSSPDKIVTSTARVGNAKFRKDILSIYDGSCAFCGFDMEEFLIASHISPHSIDKMNRLNPQNGLLLCRMCDIAFEKGFLRLTPSYEIVKSQKLDTKNNSVQSWLSSIKEKLQIGNIDYLPLEEFIQKRNDSFTYS